MIKTYNGETYIIPQAFEEEVRADERAKVLEEIKNGTYAKENSKCPICYDCPKNCPLENIK